MSSSYVNSRVSLRDGTVDRAIFVDEEIYAREQEVIFSRAWLLVGHECQVPNPDDFVLSRMGEESVILTRDRQGNLHVLLNTCRHRGMKVCRYDVGNGRIFTCPYHAWSYTTDGDLAEVPGQLVGVPQFQKHYGDLLDKREWGLKQVGKMVNYKGLIFATWDPDAPDFEDYIGGYRVFLDSALDHRDGSPGGSILLAGVQKWRTNCNWKFAPTNFCGDAGHGVSHRSVDLIGIGPSGGKGRRDERPDGYVAFGWPDLGHGGLGYAPRPEEEFIYPPSFRNHPEVSEYFEEMQRRRISKYRGRLHQQGKGTFFPNMSFHEHQPRDIIVAHPNGPLETEFWRFWLIDADTPAEVVEAMRAYYLRYSGPGGMTEQDDLENWVYATEASKGAISRRLPYNYQQGLGQSESFDGYPGSVRTQDKVTEQNQLIWMKRWAEFMEGWDWDVLMGPDKPADNWVFPTHTPEGVSA